MKKLFVILLILLAGCKTVDYICHVDAFGYTERVFYRASSRWEANRKMKQVKRAGDYAVGIYYKNKEYYVNFDCNKVNSKIGIFNRPLFTAGDTARFYPDSKNMELYKYNIK